MYFANAFAIYASTHMIYESSNFFRYLFSLYVRKIYFYIYYIILPIHGYKFCHFQQEWRTGLELEGLFFRPFSTNSILVINTCDKTLSKMLFPTTDYYLLNFLGQVQISIVINFLFCDHVKILMVEVYFLAFLGSNSSSSADGHWCTQEGEPFQAAPKRPLNSSET